MNYPKRNQYPKGFWVGDNFWRLSFCRKMKQGWVGECDFNDHVIKVLAKQTPKETLRTVCHEIVHAWFVESELEIDSQLEEAICNMMEKQMAMFIIKNF